MKMNKLTFFFAGLLLIPFIFNEAHAQQITDEGINFQTIKNPDGSFTYQTLPDRIHDGITWQSYILFEDANIIQVETGQGSYQIDKNTCNFAFYNGGKITGNPTIPSDTYLAKQSSDAIIWAEVNQINNAVCETAVIINGDDIEIQTIRTHAVGEMKIKYIKEKGTMLKSEMEVTNTSGLNDRYFGFDQLIQVPQVINFGGNQIDLATKNNTFYDRNFMINNKAELVRLTDKINYDFTKSFSNLLGITVLYDGVDTFLKFDYTNNAQILPDGQTFVIDPTLAFTPTVDGYQVYGNPTSSGTNCPVVTTGWTNVGSLNRAIQSDADGAGRCIGTIWWFNVTGIPDGSATTVTQAVLRYDIVLSQFTKVCTMREMQFTSITGFEDLYNDSYNGTEYFTADTMCTDPVANDYTKSLPQTALDRIEVDLADNEFGLSIIMDEGAGTRTSSGVRDVDFGLYSTSEIEITYIVGPVPDAVTDLVAGNEGSSTVDLNWSAPNLNGGIFVGYQLNLTTPFGNPTTLIINNTGTSDTAFAVSGLTQNTNYSFRVSVWSNVTNNATGNIENITTLSLGNFTVGAINIEATNLDFRTWKFVRTDINSSALSLSVIYPNTYNATCSFHFKFAMIDQNFSNLATSPSGSSELEATFVFNNTANEVIDVLCIDENLATTPEGIFLLTQSNFLLLQQFAEFRDGTYGTLGMIGSIDLITMVGIIVAMIGFNRVNESVGYFFLIAILGVMAFFQIIIWPVALSGMIIVIGVLTYTSTRKPG